MHLPTSTGGNSFGLSRAERKIGLKSDVLTINKNYLDYPSDIEIDIPKKRINKIIYLYKNIKMINENYDILHFNFGTSLYSNDRFKVDFLDLYFYKKDMRFFVTYNGCDCRQKYNIINNYNICACSNPDCYNGACSSEQIDLIKQRKIKKMSQFCKTIFFLNPDLKQFLPEDSIFLPYSIASWENITRKKRNYRFPLKVVHAPSQRGAKGTIDILNIINKLQKKYPDKIEFILVEGLKNSEAIRIYEQADILIDQILIGWYGALSVEAMKAGCAVMVYIRENDLKYIPIIMHEDVKKTFINCNKDNLYDKIVDIIENPSILYQYSNFSYDYVNTWHYPDYVASITKKYYE